MDSSNNRSNNKIAYIYRDNNSTKKELGFDYDAMGNRIAKHIYSATGVFEKSTYYVRDASGNTMSTYESLEEPEGEWSYMLIERHIYGSSRLGMDIETVELVDPIPTTQDPIQRTLGLKQYELSNHLGNVLSVINDMKLPVLDAGVITSFTTVVVSATDYSPFGVALYGRSYTTEAYRYGFNGKEKDSETTAGAYDFGARIYDGRLGRWLSVDPLYASSPFESPFCSFANNPVIYEDPDGCRIRGTIGGLIKFYRYRAQLKARLAQATLAGNVTLVVDLANQMGAIQTLRDSETTYYFKVKEFPKGKNNPNDRAFGILARKDKNRKNGRVDISINKEHPSVSLAGAATLAAIADSGDDNPGWSYGGSGQIDSGNLGLEDQSDWQRIITAQSTWMVDPNLKGTDMINSEKDRLALINNAMQKSTIQALPQGPLNLDDMAAKPGECDNGSMDNNSPCAHDPQYTFGMKLWHKGGESYFNDIVLSRIIYWKAQDNLGNKYYKSGLDDSLRWNSPEKRKKINN